MRFVYVLEKILLPLNAFFFLELPPIYFTERFNLSLLLAYYRVIFLSLHLEI